MGIFINIAISKSVTKNEWESVYRESLGMMKVFPLAERRKVRIYGIDTICLVRSAERKDVYGWNKDKIRVGWNAIGDYEQMCTAENYYLPRDLVEENEYVENCEDAMFGVLPCYLDYKWDDKRFDFIYEVWGSKTQGEPYHMYLLSIACMIESRLGNKAFVYGDITRGQCVEAVNLANEILDVPIEIPARCDYERLLTRIDTMPVTQSEKLRIFDCFYLGNMDMEYGEFIRDHFSVRSCNMFWKKSFEDCSIGYYRFDTVFMNYLSWGFDFKKMFRFVNFMDKDGNPKYEDFVKCVMDAKLHWPEKDCSDPLVIDQDESAPFSIYTYLAQFAFAGARNRKINRYIPIEEIRSTLKKEIGANCDVDSIIDEYLEKESGNVRENISDSPEENRKTSSDDPDVSEAFKQVMDIKLNQIQKDHETYDVAEFDDLIYYKKGNTIHPDIMKSLGKSFVFYSSITSEHRYSELMQGSYRERCEYLVENNRSILIRDKDWRKIFRDIREHKNSFERYYPMVRVKVESDGIADMIKGIVMNNDLYAYCAELADKYGTESDTNDE